MSIPPIFISHSHYDNDACQALVDFIGQVFPDADIFFDKRQLLAGDEWMHRIQKEVVSRPIFIVVLFHHSITSGWVRQETHLALSRVISDTSRIIIPIRIDRTVGQVEIDMLAPLLNMRQIMDFAPQASLTATDNELLQMFRMLYGSIPQVIHSLFLEPPPQDPQDYEREREQHPHQKCFPAYGCASTLVNGYHIVGASVRGLSHSDGRYRDDNFAIHQVGNEAALIAIADGMGGNVHSRKGVLAAVTGAGKAIRAYPHFQILIDAVQLRKGSDALIAKLSTDFMLYVLDSASKAIQECATSNNLSPDDLHSTFLAYLVIPRSDQRLFVVSAQIGDGALMVRTLGEYGAAPEWSFLQERQVSSINNRVPPFLRFNSQDWPDVIKMHTLALGSTLIGMTDGTVDDMSVEVDRDTGNFRDYEDFFAKTKNESLDRPEPGQGMAKFLQYKKRASRDDRTIVCVY